MWEVNERNKFRVRDSDCWSRCYRRTRSDRIKYLDIRAEIGIGVDIIATVEEKMLNWLGHLKRMSRERWPKKVWEWTQLNRRKNARELFGSASTKASDSRNEIAKS